MYLNFMAYLGNLYGVFHVEGEGSWPLRAGEPKNPPVTSEELLRTWDWMVESKKKRYQQGRSSLPAILTQDFSEIPDEKLRAACLTHWDDFLNWWHMPAGGQYALYYWENAPQLHRYVAEYEQSVGRKIRAFSLYIDLVYTGPRVEESEGGYMILPLDNQNILHSNWWKDLFTRIEV